jgi:Beta-lactamase class C and other penicillin binding proteins
MTKIKVIAALLCILIAIPSLAQSSAPKPPAQPSAVARTAQGLSADKVEQVDAFVAAWMAQHKAPALSVAIVTDNQLRWTKAYGLADVENAVPAKADTAYRLASISKSITATAVMQLVEKGKLDLDAPIQKYCAAFPQKQ